MSTTIHSGISVEITNQLIAVVFSCNSGANIVVVVGIVSVIIITCVNVVVGGGVDGRVSVSVET